MSLLPGAARGLHQQPLAPQFWYWEPVWCIERLFEEVSLTGSIYDPCCGSGRIPIAARKFGYEASGSDLVDRGFGTGGVNFLTDPTLRKTIVCNPPSDKKAGSLSLRDKIVKHAIEVAEVVAMIVPVPWQCGRWRRDNLFRRYLPRLILACGDRPSMPPGGTDIKAAGGTTDYCWVL